MRKFNNYRKGRTCSACATPISDHNRTGRCRPCIMADPEFRRKAVEGFRRALAATDPELRMQRVKRMHRGRDKLMIDNPERWAELCRQNFAGKRTPENEARRIAALREAAAKRKAQRTKTIDPIEVSRAADHLRKFAPVKRLDDGSYRYGNAILTEEELLARAKVRGFANDAEKLAGVA